MVIGEWDFFTVQKAWSWGLPLSCSVDPLPEFNLLVILWIEAQVIGEETLLIKGR